MRRNFPSSGSRVISLNLNNPQDMMMLLTLLGQGSGPAFMPFPFESAMDEPEKKKTVYVKNPVLRDPSPMNSSNAQEAPKVIHFFWAGGKIREAEIKNIMTFLFNTDSEWKVKIWTDKTSNITKPLTQLGITPEKHRIEIAEYHDFAKQTIAEMKQIVSSDKNSNDVNDKVAKLQVALEFIQRMSVGMKNPAAVKDVMVPMILWKEGGFYFDADVFAHQKVQAVKLPHGYGLTCSGGRVDVFASLPKSQFWVDSLLVLRDKLETHTDPKARKGSFFDLSVIKSYKNPKERSGKTVQITGFLEKEAFRKDAPQSTSLFFLPTISSDYADERNLPSEMCECGQHEDANKLKIGVTITSPDHGSNWRYGDDPKYVDDMDLVPEPKPLQFK